MFTPWETVRPRYWYPMSSIEQSMMDMDRMADEMFQARHPFRRSLLNFPETFAGVSDEEFFKDLPVSGPTEKLEDVAPKEPEKIEASPEPVRRGYSNYTFSTSSVLDDKGQRVESTRRRYEDSTGRLKAIHERKIGDKTYRSVWNKKGKDDKGSHEQICSAATEDEFEKIWKNTPFGQAQEKKALEGEKMPEE